MVCFGTVEMTYAGEERSYISVMHGSDERGFAADSPTSTNEEIKRKNSTAEKKLHWIHDDEHTVLNSRICGPID